jgi:hypothetical protein
VGLAAVDGLVLGLVGWLPAPKLDTEAQTGEPRNAQQPTHTHNPHNTQVPNLQLLSAGGGILRRDIDYIKSELLNCTCTGAPQKTDEPFASLYKGLPADDPTKYVLELDGSSGRIASSHRVGVAVLSLLVLALVLRLMVVLSAGVLTPPGWVAQVARGHSEGGRRQVADGRSGDPEDPGNVLVCRAQVM